MLTWGDGVSDVNLHELLEFHRAHGKLATLTAVRPPARFGHMVFDGDQVARVLGKAADRWRAGSTARSSCCEPGVFDYIDGDETQWEQEPLERLAADGQLMAYRHTAFWQCMDTLRDKKLLEELWQKGGRPLESVGGLIMRVLRDRTPRLHRDGHGPHAARQGT